VGGGLGRRSPCDDNSLGHGDWFCHRFGKESTDAGAEQHHWWGECQRKYLVRVEFDVLGSRNYEGLTGGIDQGDMGRVLVS